MLAPHRAQHSEPADSKKHAKSAQCAGTVLAGRDVGKGKSYENIIDRGHGFYR